jgi:hypothetical protein
MYLFYYKITSRVYSFHFPSYKTKNMYMYNMYIHVNYFHLFLIKSKILSNLNQQWLKSLLYNVWNIQGAKLTGGKIKAGTASRMSA